MHLESSTQEIVHDDDASFAKSFKMPTSKQPAKGCAHHVIWNSFKGNISTSNPSQTAAIQNQSQIKSETNLAQHLSSTVCTIRPPTPAIDWATMLMLSVHAFARIAECVYTFALVGVCAPLVHELILLLLLALLQLSVCSDPAPPAGWRYYNNCCSQQNSIAVAVHFIRLMPFQ